MRKNKTLAFALAASLLVGGTFVGTKAWFTTSKTVNSGLVITTGNINLDVKGENVWTSVGNNKETLPGQKKNEFTNVKPGDVFENTVTITKSGSLNQNITVEGGEIKALNDDRFEVRILDDLGKDITNLATKVSNDLNIDKREASSEFTVVVTVTDKMDNKDNGNLNPIELSQIIETLQIDGTQDK